MRKRTLTVGVAVLLLTGLIFPAQAGAAGRGHHGHGSGTRIVWSRFVDLDFSALRIVIGRPDGTHVRELTHSSDGVEDINAQISPNGKLVVFERDLPPIGQAELVLVGSDGRGERVLDLGCTDPCAGDAQPTWDPDGRHILFTRAVGPFDEVNDSAHSAVLYRSDLWGRHVERVSELGIDGAYEDYSATIAPSGLMVFLRVRNADIHSAVYRREGLGHSVRITPWLLDADLPSISPARRGPTKNTVVFETFGHGTPDDVTSQAIATVPGRCPVAKCRDSIRLLTGAHARPQENFNPSWSPGGHRIVFTRFSFDEATQTPVGDIWKMRWDGSHKRAISTSPLFEFRPDWGVAAH